jgi:hypothetical protein
MRTPASVPHTYTAHEKRNPHGKEKGGERWSSQLCVPWNAGEVIVESGSPVADTAVAECASAQPLLQIAPRFSE